MTYILILIAFAAWTYFAWRKPRLAVLTLPALLPIYLVRIKIGPLPSTLLEIVWLATLVGVTLKNGLAPWKDGFNKIRPWRLPLGLWWLATIIAIFVAPDRIAALGLWRAYVLEPIIFFILLNGFLKTAEDFWAVVYSLMASVFFVAAWAATQFLTGLGIPHPWNTSFLTRRATGPFPYPNAVSLFCAPLAALFFGLANGFLRPERSGAELKDLSKGPSTSSGRQYLYWPAFAVATLATLLAKSVGGALAILVSVAVLLLWNKRTRLPTLGAIILGITIIFAVPQFRTPTIQTLTFNGWSGRVRMWMYQETWSMLKDRPILGAGFGAYPTVFKPYHKKTFIEIFQYPHDIVLNLWSETGLLGLIAFIWIIATWVRLVVKKKADTSVRPYTPLPITYILPLIAILVQGLVDVPYFKNDLAFAFWILAALTTYA